MKKGKEEEREGGRKGRRKKGKEEEREGGRKGRRGKEEEDYIFKAGLYNKVDKEVACCISRHIRSH